MLQEGWAQGWHPALQGWPGGWVLILIWSQSDHFSSLKLPGEGPLGHQALKPTPGTQNPHGALKSLYGHAGDTALTGPESKEHPAVTSEG